MASEQEGFVQVGYRGSEADMDALMEFAENRGMKFVWGDLSYDPENPGWPAMWGERDLNLLADALAASGVPDASREENTSGDGS